MGLLFASSSSSRLIVSSRRCHSCCSASTRRRVTFVSSSAFLLLSRILDGQQHSLVSFAEEEEEEEEDWKVFEGDSCTFRYPPDWVVAVNRPINRKGRKKGQTLAVLGQFKTVDTVSVRLEFIDLNNEKDETVKEAFEKALQEEDATIISDEFTKEDREIAAGSIPQGVVPGFENNKSGVIKFINVPESARLIGRKFFTFQSISEVCRGEISLELSGGMKMCVGPKGDEIETIERRSLMLITPPNENDGSYFVVKMSAKNDRWDQVERKFEKLMNSFSLL